MIKIVRRKVPEAEFRVGSLFEADIPACYAATAVSEVLNYPFDTENGGRGLIRLFCPRIRSAGSRRRLCLRCHRAGAGLAGAATRGFSEGKDRMVLVEKGEDLERGTLTRRIVSFRKEGEHYRRDDEVHRQRLYRPSEIAGELRRADFRVWTRRGYGGYTLPKAHVASVARKPA